jgi:hypothetical protein
MDLALMAVLGIALTLVPFNPPGITKPLEDAEVMGCDGKTVSLDGGQQRGSSCGEIVVCIPLSWG